MITKNLNHYAKKNTNPLAIKEEICLANNMCSIVCIDCDFFFFVSFICKSLCTLGNSGSAGLHLDLCFVPEVQSPKDTNS